jgi:hypothetical protein
MLVFGYEHAETLPDNRGCDHWIQLLTSNDQFHMGRIYRFSTEKETILVESLAKMIREGKMWPSSSSVGSPIYFVPKPNGKRLRLCVNYRHLNDHTKNDKIPLPILDKLSLRLWDCNFIIMVNMKEGFHL